MAINGWLIIVDWKYNNVTKEWQINNIHNAKVASKILDVEIMPNVWYWFEDGNLNIEENK